MPYIKPVERVELDGWIKPLVKDIESEGQLNYVISKIIHGYLSGRSVRYGTLNGVMGVLECAKQEFYRTVVVPYEKIKKAENGPVSELDEDNK